MKITVLGTGNIGGTLGHKWAAQGYELTFGTREPQAEIIDALTQLYFALVYQQGHDRRLAFKALGIRN